MKAKYILVLAIVLLLSYPVSVLLAGKPRFQGLGDLEGKMYHNSAYAVSADGSAVVGSSTSNSGSEAFRWTASGGMQGLGDLPGGSFISSAFGVSADGSVVVGDSETGYCQRKPFRWTESGGMQSLGDLGGIDYRSGAKDVSADGSVVVGSSYSTLGKEAFRWTESDDMVGLGDLPGGVFESFTEGVSADGLVAVGWSESTLGREAFCWTESEGMQGLGFLHSTGLLNSQAYDISADGSTIVGLSGSVPKFQAFLWTESEGMLGLGYLPGDDWRSLANAVSSDGSVVVGSGIGFEDDHSEAFIWDEVHGMRNIKGLLVNDFGLDIAGWTLYQATGISDDGMTIVGTGLNPDGYIEGWIAVLPKPAIIYVDDDATGNNDGSSWADAFNYLQDALAAAWDGDEIHVAQGIYTPDSYSTDPNGSGDREATFQLINGVTLKGGYAGFSEPDPNTRDIELYETILSGDLNGDDGPNFTNNSDNSYHVASGSGIDANAVLDGFTITAGNANGLYFPYYCGGGMYNNNSSPTLTNCTFAGNLAKHGGGMYNLESSPTLSNCTFSGNSVWVVGGGGMYNENSSPTLSNCTFSDNSANRGGGMHNRNSSPMLTNCTFSGNRAIATGHPGSAEGCGGGMENWSSSPTLTNCKFSGNLASRWGGGMCNVYSNPTVTNCTFAGNAATNGNALGFDSYLHQGPSNVQITNCILWDGGNEIWNNDGSTIAITYSDMEGGWPGVGNIDDDPCFVEPGFWDANGVWIDGNYHLLPISPCIDAGDPNYIPEPNETDFDGKPRVMNGRIDMGAYESPIFAEARILPRTINLASKGKWITSYIWLPKGYDVADIDPNSVFLEDEIKPEDFSVDQQKQVAVLRFSREDVQPILEVGDIKLAITGQLTDGIYFEAADIVQVTDKGSGKSSI